MNERIKLLAERANLEIDPAHPDHNQKVLEKFAGLIVRECMACSIWVGKMNTNSGEPIQTAHAINQRIKQQFGVEE
jgi:hypothetical protein